MYTFFDKCWKIIKKYNEISNKVSDIIKKEFDSKPVYNEKYIKTKMKSYAGTIIILPQ